VASNRIKGITIEINGETTRLQKALKGVESQLSTTQTALKDVEKLLKLDPKNTELLAQKQKYLADAISETKSKLATLNDAYAQLSKKISSGDLEGEDLKTAQRNMDDLKREIIDTEAKLKTYEDTASGAADKTKDLGDKGKSAGDGLDTLKIAAGNLAAELTSKVFSAMGQVVDVLGDLAQTGLESYETLRAGKRTFQQLGETSDQASEHVKELADATLGLSVASADQVAYGQRMKASFNSITEEGTDYADIVNAITHGVVALNGSTEGLETAQTQLSQVFATGKMTQQDYNSIMGACPALLSELAKQMLGADATAIELKEAIADGSVSLDDLANGLKNADVGAWADQAGAASGTLGDLFTQMKQSVANAFRDILDYGEEGNTVYDQLKDVVQSLKDKISDVVDVIKKFLSEHEEQITKFMTFISDHIGLIIGVVAGLTTVLTILATTIAIVTAAQMALNVVGAPVIGIITAVIVVIGLLVAAGIALYKNWDTIKEKASQLKEKIVIAFNEIKSKVLGIVDKAKTWGRDLINNLIGGISEKIGNLKKKASEIASTISSYIHFSVPDQGPLKDADTFMPDMIDLMVKGIDKNEYRLADAVEGMASTMAMSPNSGLTSSLGNITNLLSQGNVIMLDTGELVGATAKSYNAEFGRIARLEAAR